MSHGKHSRVWRNKIEAPQHLRVIYKNEVVFSRVQLSDQFIGKCTRPKIQYLGRQMRERRSQKCLDLAKLTNDCRLLSGKENKVDGRFRASGSDELK
jgi:hypothetical protein